MENSFQNMAVKFLSKQSAKTETSTIIIFLQGQSLELPTVVTEINDCTEVDLV